MEKLRKQKRATGGWEGAQTYSLRAETDRGESRGESDGMRRMDKRVYVCMYVYRVSREIRSVSIKPLF